MSLNRLLSIPDDEKAVLFLGEAHDDDYSLEHALSVLDAFQPDAIALEMGRNWHHTTPLEATKVFLTEKVMERPICEEDFVDLGYFGPACMSIAEVYALKNEIPLYYLDMSPFCPEHQPDVRVETPLGLPYLELNRCMRQMIDILHGPGTSKKLIESARPKDVALAEYNYCAGMLPPEEVKAAIQKYVMGVSDIGVGMRNEYTAMALNLREETRIAYAGGAHHLFPPKKLLSSHKITPLQKLVDAPHKYVLDMRTPNKLKQMLGGNIIQREVRHKELQYDWDLINFYCSECGNDDS